jgi:hypothetical protein
MRSKMGLEEAGIDRDVVIDEDHEPVAGNLRTSIPCRRALATL